MGKAEHLAFICPRFPEGSSAGGAETLLKGMAGYCARTGRQTTFLTTCARNHFTWANELPEGPASGTDFPVIRFPVDTTRDIPLFLEIQAKISTGMPVSAEEEMSWLRNSVNSSALYEFLKTHGSKFDRIVAGPYLFGITFSCVAIAPGKTVLVPCLHDECFAYLGAFRQMFNSAGGILFNSEPEKELATRLFGQAMMKMPVIGMGIPEPDPMVFQAPQRITEAPYIIYSGRREPMKNTPLLLDYFTAFRERTGENIHLVLTGSGNVDIPDSTAPFVKDAGFVDEADKFRLMAGAVAFIHPSTNESFGIVAMESWLCGTPLLVHNESLVLRHHCARSDGGLWFRNYPEFEACLLLLLKDRKTRDRLGENGRNYVKSEYSWESVGPRLLDALDGIT